MTLEEAQEIILKQKDELKELNLKYDNLNNTYSELKTNSHTKENELNDRILELQEHAQKLFLQLAQEPKETKEVTPSSNQKLKTLDDIIEEWR